MGIDIYKSVMYPDKTYSLKGLPKWVLAELNYLWVLLIRREIQISILEEKVRELSKIPQK